MASKTLPMGDAPTVGASEEEAAAKILEKVINTEDFVDVRYLESGTRASRAVCRAKICDETGALRGYGTASLVSPGLVLTNHHVFPTAEIARASSVEFNFQDGTDGQPLQSVLFRLDPDAFFFADRTADFAITAVQANPSRLAEFGFNQLIEAQGKALIGENVTIVQHPRGDKKQVALRENKIVDRLDEFLHYEADTDPGSSGSPVFNDQWEIVALHHASVPTGAPGAPRSWINEGVRISSIIKLLRASVQPDTLSDTGKALMRQLLSPPSSIGMTMAVQPLPPERNDPEQVARVQANAVVAATQSDGSVRIVVPLEVSVRLGGVSPASPARTAMGGVVAPLEHGTGEAIVIDPNYGNRKGYDPEFLGTDKLRVSLPKLPADATVAKRIDEPGKFLLPYHHFSLAVNRERRLAYFTAVNINGRLSQRLDRGSDRWFFDPRLSPDDQVGEDLYTKNKLDRGHLVRRLDPTWGTSRAAAEKANNDTFHFTNCSPQHKTFNQNKTLWAGLEDYILNNADNKNFKVNVFSGPVFADDDEDYRDIKLPRQFWKVVTMVKQDGKLSATGYLLSQAVLLKQQLDEATFAYGEYKTFQVPIKKIESLTGLTFGSLPAHDPKKKEEIATLELAEAATELRSLDELEL